MSLLYYELPKEGKITIHYLINKLQLKETAFTISQDLLDPDNLLKIDKDLSLSVIRCLGFPGNSDSLPLLNGVCAKGTKEQKIEAIISLGNIGDKDSIPVLIETFHKAHSFELHYKIFLALICIDPINKKVYQLAKKIFFSYTANTLLVLETIDCIFANKDYKILINNFSRLNIECKKKILQCFAKTTHPDIADFLKSLYKKFFELEQGVSGYVLYLLLDRTNSDLLTLPLDKLPLLTIKTFLSSLEKEKSSNDLSRYNPQRVITLLINFPVTLPEQENFILDVLKKMLKKISGDNRHHLTKYCISCLIQSYDTIRQNEILSKQAFSQPELEKDIKNPMYFLLRIINDNKDIELYEQIKDYVKNQLQVQRRKILNRIKKYASTIYQNKISVLIKIQKIFSKNNAFQIRYLAKYLDHVFLNKLDYVKKTIRLSIVLSELQSYRSLKYLYTMFKWAHRENQEELILNLHIAFEKIHKKLIYKNPEVYFRLPLKEIPIALSMVKSIKYLVDPEQKKLLGILVHFLKSAAQINYQITKNILLSLLEIDISMYKTDLKYILLNFLKSKYPIEIKDIIIQILNKVYDDKIINKLKDYYIENKYILKIISLNALISIGKIADLPTKKMILSYFITFLRQPKLNIIVKKEVIFAYFAVYGKIEPKYLVSLINQANYDFIIEILKELYMYIEIDTLHIVFQLLKIPQQKMQKELSLLLGEFVNHDLKSVLDEKVQGLFK